MEDPRILITTGGTGGHIFPALAVIEQIREMSPQAKILFVGSQNGPESRFAAEAGVDFIGISVSGVLGHGIGACVSLFRMVKAVFTAHAIIKDFRPHVIAGFGSYASLPSLLAAKPAGIPIIIHEQNAVPGLSNRLTGKIASRIYLTMPDKFNRFSARKTTLVGNPVRSAITALRDHRHNTRNEMPRLLVMGGSQGAKAINTAIIESLPDLADIFIHHQTGKADFERVRDAYDKAGINKRHVSVEPFITDMSAAYAKADLVVSRSGATTAAELSLAGIPAVFIPFPYATHDHQTANARAFEEAGAAYLIPADKLTAATLTAAVRELIHDRTRLARMSESAQKLGAPDAARQVAHGILDFAQ